MDKYIDRIPKNADTDIIIRVDDFGGKRGVTIREFVKGERYTGFTKAGTRIPAEHFKAFKQAINSIKEEELLEGLMDGSKVGMKEPVKEQAKGHAIESKDSGMKKGKAKKQADENLEFSDDAI